MSERAPSRRELLPARGQRRSRPGRRPSIEGLEGRTLLSYGGSPDPSFLFAGYPLVAKAVAAQADGKVVVVGTISLGTDYTMNPIRQQVAVAAIRLNPDGTRDLTFGASGTFEDPLLTVNTPDLPAVATAGGVAIQPDGKILLATSVGPVAEVVRLTADGHLDPSFGAGGIVTLGTVGSGDSRLDLATSVASLPGGQVAVGGAIEPMTGQFVPAVERLHVDGSVDASYGTAGLAVVPLPAAASAFDLVDPYRSLVAPQNGIVAQADGKVIIDANAGLPAGAYAPSEIVSTRLDLDGKPDAGFGTGGQAIVDLRGLGVGPTSATALTLQPDGKLVIGGSASGIVPNLLAVRLDLDGKPDPSFGIAGASVTVVRPLDYINPFPTVGAIAIQADGKVVLADSSNLGFVRLGPGGLPDVGFGTGGSAELKDQRAPDVFQSIPGFVGVAVQADGKILAAQGGGYGPGLVRVLGQGATGDYDGDGLSDPAIYDTTLGQFTFYSSANATTTTVAFGTPGAGQSLPSPGAYAGFGLSGLAVYLPTLGAFAIRTFDGNPDAITPFGPSGPGQALPAPGDYDGSGQTGYAVYVPGAGAFLYRPGGGGPAVAVGFGTPGVGKSIPAPADYFGTGQTDLAVYLPDQGAYAIRNPVTNQDDIIPFGTPGAGNAIPVPGDYDGSGHAELAVYVPAYGVLIYRPSNGGPDVVEPFGIPGAGMTLPAPGDYDGSGKTEVAAYFPSLGLFGFRPADGGPDVLFPLGKANQSIPFVAASATDGGAGGSGGGGGFEVRAASVEIPLTPDVLETLDGTTARKAARSA